MLGETLEKPSGLLARTGAVLVETLVALALGLLVAGGALRLLFSRRERSASSPG